MNQHIKSWLTGIAATALLSVSATASAQFYIGGGIGDGTIETNENTPVGSFNFDESDFAWKIFGGYMFSEYLGVETAYIDMGSPSQNFSFEGGQTGQSFDADFRGEFSGFSVHGLAAYPFGPFEVFGKLGIISYDAEFEAKRRDTGEHLKLEDEGEELAYGVGGRYNIDNFALRFEYEVYDAGDIDDVSMWVFGAELSF